MIYLPHHWLMIMTSSLKRLIKLAISIVAAWFNRSIYRERGWLGRATIVAWQNSLSFQIQGFSRKSLLTVLLSLPLWVNASWARTWEGTWLQVLWGMGLSLETGRHNTLAEDDTRREISPCGGEAGLWEERTCVHPSGAEQTHW